MKEFFKYFWKNLKEVIKDLTGKDKEKRRKQIPNTLTLIRGFLAPITIIPAVLAENIKLAVALIAISALTDTFDGWYARHRNAQSEFGAILDAICDKIFIITLVLPILIKYSTSLSGILIGEIIIAIINSYASLKGYEAHSSYIGKIKTIILDFTIALFYFNLIIVNKVDRLLYGMVFATNILQIICIWEYYKLYRIKRKTKKEEIKTQIEES